MQQQQIVRTRKLSMPDQLLNSQKSSLNNSTIAFKKTRSAVNKLIVINLVE